jgi:hypothetical protein
VVKGLNKEEKGGLRCNSIIGGTCVVYYKQLRTGPQGNEIKTGINKHVDLMSVEGLLLALEMFGKNKWN